MSLYNVYPRFDVAIERGEGALLFDEQGQAYLDMYGGHGVISVGHAHPDYVQALTEQSQKLGFYSNSISLPIQSELSDALQRISGYANHSVFYCNSGAEAVENALKLASFHTGRSRVIAFEKSFHGRTEAALAVTDNPKLKAPLNTTHFPVTFLPLNDVASLQEAMLLEDVAAVIVEGIQGVGGLDLPNDEFLRALRELCTQHGTLLILDEIQSGCGRSGQFFAHQSSGVEADLITMAKGLGNGFPIGAVLIGPQFEPFPGQLGTTFGGNPLGCAAALAVLQIIEKEGLMQNAVERETQFREAFADFPVQIKGKGLMLGIEWNQPISEIRRKLVMDRFIFTGNASNPNVIRILPPLNVTASQLDQFINALKGYLQ